MEKQIFVDIRRSQNAGNQNFTAGSDHFPLVDIMILTCVDMADGYVNLITVLVQQYDQGIYDLGVVRDCDRRGQDGVPDFRSGCQPFDNRILESTRAVSAVYRFHQLRHG